MSDAMLIVAALNGMRSRAECPKVPLTPDEIAAEAKRAVDAGAGLVHVQARRADGAVVFDPSYDEIIAAIRKKVDVPISIPTQRTRQTSLGTITAIFRVMREIPDLATVGVRSPEPDLPSHREEARQILEASEEAGVKPFPIVIGIDSFGDLETLYNDSMMRGGRLIQIELGTSDGRGTDRMAGTPQNVLRLGDSCASQFSRFAWVASGMDEASPVVQAVAAAAGGHIRVGFEDAATLPDGSPATSNGQLVERAAGFAVSLGRPLMSPAEARALIG
jgi:3-keto-5-aminohexanoate cleavage enzyme